jgi:hypothetical protein
MSGRRRTWPRRLLAVLLVAWEPASFALYASSLLFRLVERGPLAVAALAAHLVVTGVGLAAGLALWSDRPGATTLARLALVLSASLTLGTFATSAFPPAAPPGLAGPLTALMLAYDAAWFVYLSVAGEPDE